MSAGSHGSRTISMVLYDMASGDKGLASIELVEAILRQFKEYAHLVAQNGRRAGQRKADGNRETPCNRPLRTSWPGAYKFQE
jgi:hypothetical protein